MVCLASRLAGVLSSCGWGCLDFSSCVVISGGCPAYIVAVAKKTASIINTAAKSRPSHPEHVHHRKDASPIFACACNREPCPLATGEAQERGNVAI